MYLFPDIKIEYLQKNLLCFTSTLMMGLSHLKNYEPFPEGLFPEVHVTLSSVFL